MLLEGPLELLCAAGLFALAWPRLVLRPEFFFAVLEARFVGLLLFEAFGFAAFV
jgi:hypothetical protein